MIGLALLVATALSPSAEAAGSDSSGAAPPTMQWQVQDLVIIRKVAPVYPSGISPEERVAAACRAAIRVDGAGVPIDIRVEGCPLPFVQETERALSDWRWAPWGTLAERRVTLTVRFTVPARFDAAPAPAPEASPVWLGATAPALPQAAAPSAARPAAAHTRASVAE